jgi:hypothetical protein
VRKANFKNRKYMKVAERNKCDGNENWTAPLPSPGGRGPPNSIEDGNELSVPQEAGISS